MTEWVVSIGTGAAQQPLIAAARRKGFRVLGIDRVSRPEVVDQVLVHSTYDTHGVLAAIAEMQLRPFLRAVLARTSGPAVLTAAKLADFLGVAGCGVDLASASVSKSVLRQIAARLGVSVVKGWLCQETPVWQMEADLVIKPDQPMQGKRNVYRVRTAEELCTAFAAASAESLNGYVECQPFYAGRDVGVVQLWHAGICLWNTVYEERVGLSDGRFVGIGVSWPVSGLSVSQHESVLEAATRMSLNWQAQGFVFHSFRVPEDGPPLLYETNPGLCGDGIVDQLFGALWPDCDFYELDLAVMCGQAPTNLPALPSCGAEWANGVLRSWNL